MILLNLFLSSSSDDALARVQETLKKWNDYFEERDIPCLISVHCIRASLNALRGKKHGGDDIFDYTDVTDEIWLEFELGTIEKKTKQKYSSSKKNRVHTRRNNGRTRKYQKRVSSSESEDENSDFDSSESSSSINHKHSSSRKNRGRRYHKNHNRRHQKAVSSSSSNDHKHSSSKKVQKQSHTVEL